MHVIMSIIQSSLSSLWIFSLNICENCKNWTPQDILLYFYDSNIVLYNSGCFFSTWSRLMDTQDESGKPWIKGTRNWMQAFQWAKRSIANTKLIIGAMGRVALNICTNEKNINSSSAQCKICWILISALPLPIWIDSAEIEQLWRDEEG